MLMVCILSPSNSASWVQVFTFYATDRSAWIEPLCLVPDHIRTVFCNPGRYPIVKVYSPKNLISVANCSSFHVNSEQSFLCKLCLISCRIQGNCLKQKLPKSEHVTQARNTRVGIRSVTHLMSGLEGNTVSFDFPRGLSLFSLLKMNSNSFSFLV